MDGHAFGRPTIDRGKRQIANSPLFGELLKEMCGSINSILSCLIQTQAIIMSDEWLGL